MWQGCGPEGRGAGGGSRSILDLSAKRCSCAVVKVAAPHQATTLVGTGIVPKVCLGGRGAGEGGVRSVLYAVADSCNACDVVKCTMLCLM